MEVVLVRAGALGDVLLLRRAVAALRRGGHRVRLVAPAAAAAALVGPGPSEVEAALPWDGPEAAALLAGEPATGALAKALETADLVVAFSRDPEIAGALGRVARRVIARDPAPPTEGPHASVWLAGALADSGVAWDERLPPDLSFVADERAEASRRLAALPPRFVAVHPGSGSASKNWPLDRFTEVAERLSRGAPFLLCVGPAELERGLAAGAPRAAVVARAWPVRVLGAALSRASLYLGNDSGVSHLAAAAGAPTLALFGPTDPRLWSPVGRVVRTLRGPDARPQSVAAEEVWRAALELVRG